MPVMCQHCADPPCVDVCPTGASFKRADGIVLVDHNRRLMFTGDVFYPAPLYAHLEGSSVEEYARTAERLAAMAADVDDLLPSHNVPVASSDYLRQMDTAFKAIIAGTARSMGLEVEG